MASSSEPSPSRAPSPGAFADQHVELLKTFADQAVIAIENVRLFNETKEALERQTATAEILKVISSSPTDTQPVFDAIVRNATSLCEGMYANVFRYDGEMLHYVASHGWPPQLLQVLHNSYPVRPDRLRVSGRVILEKRAVRLEDTRSDPDYDPDLARALEYRRILGIPMLREGNVIGVISVGWAEPGPIQQRHEDLLKTFADQAVIAIENVRLFNETKEALERQTATAEILRVISRLADRYAAGVRRDPGASDKAVRAPMCSRHLALRGDVLIMRSRRASDLAFAAAFEQRRTPDGRWGKTIAAARAKSRRDSAFRTRSTTAGLPTQRDR